MAFGRDVIQLWLDRTGKHSVELRPKIVIAVQSQYGGHLARALVYQEILADRFHITLATVGGAPAPWFLKAINALPDKPALFHFPGPAMAEDARGRISFSRTTWQYCRNLGRLIRTSGGIAEFVFRLQPRLVISDFEPRIASFCIRYRVPLVTIDAHRRFYLRGCPRPPLRGPGVLRDYLGMQAAMLLMHRTGDLNIALSLFPIATRAKEATCVLPPLIRRSAFEIKPRAGEHLLVYHNSGGEKEDIVKQCRDIPTIVYGYQTEERIGRVHFKRSSSREFLEDLASCRAYASRAGFESVAEALLFGKPCTLVPQ
ncbi:MAG: glycosyltransferase family protein, partial [Leptospirales bacterium]